MSGVGDAAEQGDELGETRALEHERLAARPNSRNHLPEVGRAEDEQEVGRRLLDELQKRVPGRIGELVRLVEDVHLVATLDGLQNDALADLADVVDAALRGRVHLDDVERRPVRDRHAGMARLVRTRGRAIGADTVECLREDAGHRRLSGAARAREQICLPHLVVIDRVLERPDDRLLPDHLVEALGAVLPVEGAHPRDSSR